MLAETPLATKTSFTELALLNLKHSYTHQFPPSVFPNTLTVVSAFNGDNFEAFEVALPFVIFS